MIDIPDEPIPWNQIKAYQLVIVFVWVGLQAWMALSSLDFVFQFQFFPVLNIYKFTLGVECPGELFTTVYNIGAETGGVNRSPEMILAESYYEPGRPKYNATLNETAKQFFNNPCEYQGKALEVAQNGSN